MTIVADEYDHVIGVDTHARTHSYAIIEAATGRLSATETFPTSEAGMRRALSWIARHATGRQLVAAEGTSSYGAGLARLLQDSGIPVVEARPPKRAARAGRGKSDPIDAEAAARSVLGQDAGTLIVPRAGKLRSALRVLLTARRQMDTQRTANRNALTALVRIIGLDVDARKPLTDTQITQIASWRSRPTDDVEQATARDEAVRVARDILTLTQRLETNHAGLEKHVTELAPELLRERGIGPVTAATFITAYSHHGRVHGEAAFAALAGTAPIPASSGNTVRHRLNRHGDRRLNAALDVVARVRIAHDPDTRLPRTPPDRRQDTPRDPPAPEALHRPAHLPPAHTDPSNHHSLTP